MCIALWGCFTWQSKHMHTKLKLTLSCPTMEQVRLHADDTQDISLTYLSCGLYECPNASYYRNDFLTKNETKQATQNIESIQTVHRLDGS
jgi:hypothetical protein